MKTPLHFIFVSFLSVLLSAVFTPATVKAQSGWAELGAFQGNITHVATDLYGNVYVAGNFTDSGGYYNVHEWNGYGWSLLGGTHALKANGTINALTIDGNGGVYAGGSFTSSYGNPYVAKWTGTAWYHWTPDVIFSGTSSQGTYITSIAIGKNDSIYVATYNYYSNPQYYSLGVWRDLSWSIIRSRYTSPPTTDITCLITDSMGDLYAGGGLTSNNGPINGGYVYQWNDSIWSGQNALNKGRIYFNANSAVQTLATDNKGNIYAAGWFTDSTTWPKGHFYVAKWDGTTWTELGTGANALNANGPIYSIAVDEWGRVFAVGSFTDANSKAYVAMWDGNKWSSLGTGTNALNANFQINSIAIDHKGNVYAAGGFTDGRGNNYVAKYTAVAGVTDIHVDDNAAQLYPNPAGNTITLQLNNSYNSVSDKSILVTDITGRLVYAGHITETVTHINVSQWSSGMYVYTIADNTNRCTGKFMVQH